MDTVDKARAWDAITEKNAEIKRLRDALFKIQCEQLERGTDTARSAKWHREKCMATRDRIISILSNRAAEERG